jgi:hypothetical protein
MTTTSRSAKWIACGLGPVVLVALVFALPGCGGGEAKKPPPPANVNWDEAKNYIGVFTTVTGPVMDGNYYQGPLALNIGKSEGDPDRFVILIRGTKQSPDDYVGKTVSVKGTIAKINDVPMIAVSKPEGVVMQGSATP